LKKVQVNAWSSLWQSVVRFQADKVNLWLGIRNSLGVALPLAAGAAAGSISGGLIMATGALNVAFSDSDAPYRQRARQMGLASIVAGISVFIGSLSGSNHVVAVLVAGVWAFAAAMLVALSQEMADLGAMSLVMLVVYAALPLNVEQAAASGLLACAGGLFQTLLSVASWPLHRYVAERRALGEFYRELARAAASPPIQATDSPVATAESIQAQKSLASLSSDRSIESERLHFLLSQAEQIRLSLLALGRSRVRIEREKPGTPESKILEECFQIAARALGAIESELHEIEPAHDAAASLAEFGALIERLREMHSPSQLTGGARLQLDALAGQLRAANDVAAHTTRAGSAVFEQHEAQKPWNLRVWGVWATLRANMNLESAACRHAIRLSLCVALGDALGRSFSVQRSYWLPMTIAIVLKPDFSATFTRGVLRLAGTFAGLLCATAVFHALPPSRTGSIIAIALLTFVIRGLGPAHYAIVVTGVTAWVVYVLSLAGVSPGDVMAARAFNTAAGGAIALLAYWLWPTWERHQVPETMARMLDAIRHYTRLVQESYLAEAPAPTKLQQARVSGRLARSNLEASISRSATEPGTTPEIATRLNGILASSHRLVHALMALEAGLSSKPSLPRGAFRKFAHDVELTLYYLAARLRGSPLGSESLPDLLEDHHALAHSNESCPLINVETDRVANSLNTLSEKLLEYNSFG
jgi:uncharacterized membrane protein YccC